MCFHFCDRRDFAVLGVVSSDCKHSNFIFRSIEQPSKIKAASSPVQTPDATAIDFSEPLSALDMVKCFDPVPVKPSLIRRAINALKVRSTKAEERKVEPTTENADQIAAVAIDIKVEAASNAANEEMLRYKNVQHFEPDDKLDQVRCFPPVIRPPSRLQLLRQSLRNARSGLSTFTSMGLSNSFAHFRFTVLPVL